MSCAFMFDANQHTNDFLQVETTERGLPVALTLTAAALSMPPERLARAILLRTQVAARRAQVARRRHLQAQGFTSAVIDTLGLCTELQLERTEREVAQLDEEVSEEHPPTWGTR